MLPYVGRGFDDSETASWTSSAAQRKEVSIAEEADDAAKRFIFFHRALCGKYPSWADKKGSNADAL